MASKAFVDQIMLQIKHFREDAGLNQIEMAERLKIGSRSYQRYEIGESILPIDFLHRVSGILNVSIKELVSPSERLKEIGEVKFFTADQRAEFMAKAGVEADVLFKIQQSPEFQAAVSRNDMDLIKNEELFQKSSHSLAVSNPRTTLLNPAAQKEFSDGNEIIPTVSFHFSPRNVGILWGALLEHKPDFFLMTSEAQCPSGICLLMTVNLFVKKKGSYLVLKAMKKVQRQAELAKTLL